MKNIIYINKKGILYINPIWVSLNDGKYHLYFSNKIQISTTQRENTLKIRDVLFIFSKKVNVQAEEPSTILNLQITLLDSWFRIGTVFISLLCILYVMTPWTFIPVGILFYILFGYLGFYALFFLIFKRKTYFKVEKVISD